MEGVRFKKQKPGPPDRCGFSLETPQGTRGSEARVSSKNRTRSSCPGSVAPPKYEATRMAERVPMRPVIAREPPNPSMGLRLACNTIREVCFYAPYLDEAS